MNGIEVPAPAPTVTPPAVEMEIDEPASSMREDIPVAVGGGVGVEVVATVDKSSESTKIQNENGPSNDAVPEQEKEQEKDRPNAAEETPIAATNDQNEQAHDENLEEPENDTKISTDDEPVENSAGPGPGPGPGPSGAATNDDDADSSKTPTTRAEEKGTSSVTAPSKQEPAPESSEAETHFVAMSDDVPPLVKKGRQTASFYREVQPSDQLPSDWIVHINRRLTGNRTYDIYWFTKTGKRLRSHPEIVKFLGYLNDVDGDEDAAWKLLKKSDTAPKTSIQLAKREGREMYLKNARISQPRKQKQVGGGETKSKPKPKKKSSNAKFTSAAKNKNAANAKVKAKPKTGVVKPKPKVTDASKKRKSKQSGDGGEVKTIIPKASRSLSQSGGGDGKQKKSTTGKRTRTTPKKNNSLVDNVEKIIPKVASSRSASKKNKGSKQHNNALIAEAKTEKQPKFTRKVSMKTAKMFTHSTFSGDSDIAESKL